jgi:hypothetical protein
VHIELAYIYAMRRFILFLSITVFLPVLYTCGRIVLPPNIPQVPVEFTLFLFDPAYVALQGVGGWVEIPAGSRGIIVYRTGIQRFNAYERHCPYEQGGQCGRVGFDENLMFLTCNACPGESCESKFNPLDGSLMSGPSVYPLFQYRTQFDGQAMLRVFN